MFNFNKKSSRLIILAIMIIFAITSILNIDRYFENIFSEANEIEYVSVAESDSQGNYYAVAKSHTEVLKLSKDLNFVYRIESINNSKKGFNYANDIVIDDKDNIYVLSTYFDESSEFIQKEGIVRFNSKGEFEKELFMRQYNEEDAVALSGRIRTIDFLDDNTIGVAYIQGNNIASLKLNKDTAEMSDIKGFSFKDAELMVSDISIVPDFSSFYFTTKRGQIFKCDINTGDINEIYDGGANKKLFVPFEIKALGEDEIFIREAAQGKILKFKEDGSYEVVLDGDICRELGFEDDYYEFVGMKINPNNKAITFVNNSKIIQYNAEGHFNVISEWQYSPERRIINLFLWIQLVALGVLLLRILLWIVKTISKNNKKILRQSAIIVVMLVATSSIVTSYIYKNMQERDVESNYDILLTNLEIAKRVINGDKIKNIDTVEKYNSDEFLDVIKSLQETITVNGEIDYRMYSGVFILVDSTVYILTYQDMDIYAYYPLIHNYEESVYYDVFEKGEVYVGRIQDIEGDWQYVVGPIYDSQGDIVGVVEIGKDMLAYTQANRIMLKEILFNLLVIIIILLLLFVEVTIFDTKVVENKLSSSEKTEEEKVDMEVGSIRFVTVVVCLGIYMTSSFMPIYSQSMDAGLLNNLPSSIVTPLPMFTETLFLAITTIVFGHIKRNWKLKDTMAAGGIIMVLGSILTANSSTSLFLILSRALFGVGFGLFYVGMRTYTVFGKSEEEIEAQIAGFSAGMVGGVNCGGVIGSILVDNFGYKTVFYVMSVIILAGSILIYFLLSDRRKESSKKEEDTEPIKLSEFILNKSILAFYLLEFLPSAICGMFLMYFFPLFADSLGYSPLIVGRALLLYGLCTIYMGPMLTRLTSKYLGSRRSIILAPIIISIVMFVFAFNNQSIFIAFLVVIIIGLTDSFGLNQETDYFLSLDITKRYGESKSMGVYSLFECSGEAIGPMVYGIIMTLSMQRGLSLLATCLLLFIFIFSILSRQPKAAKDTVKDTAIN
ncbi:MFS transporter [Defluviitalea saccharophila]|uniref:MFS transporter n=1 Tax=Defluviitalea saccharophila TaxID=879970 RepID=A0ABZ2Y709_9FIRM